MSTTRIPLLLLPLLTLLLGCKKDPFMSASARTKRDVVQIHVTTDEGATVEVAGAKATVAPRKHQIDLHIALDKFKPGPQELTVRVEKDGKVNEELVAFTVPNGVGAPFLQLHACVEGEGEGGKVRTTILGSFGKIKDCQSGGDMRFVVDATANPKSSVTLGRETIEADDNGNLTLTIDVAKNLLDIVVSSDYSSSNAVQIPVPLMVEHDGKKLAGNLAVDVNGYSLVMGLVRSFKPGKPAHPNLAKDGPALVAYQEGDGMARFTGGPAPLRNLRIIALGKPQSSASAADCGPYTSVDGGGSMMATRSDIDVQVTAYDAATGASKGERTFSAKAEECPMSVTSFDYKTPHVEVHPNFDDIAKWLAELAT